MTRRLANAQDLDALNYLTMAGPLTFSAEYPGETAALTMPHAQSGELITLAVNRDFSGAGNWAGTNWAVSGGKLVHTTGSTATAVLAAANFTSQSLIKNRTYQFIITVSGSTAGTLSIKLGTAGVASAINTDATYTNLIVCGEDDGDLILTPSSTFNGSVDDISIIRWASPITILNNGYLGFGDAAPQRKVVFRTDSSSRFTQVAFYNANLTAANGSVISFRGDTSTTPFNEFAAIGNTIDDHTHATRTGSLLFYTSASGGATARLIITGAGLVTVGAATGAARFQVTGSTDIVQAVIKAHSTQTALLQTWQNSSATVLSNVGPLGQLSIGSNAIPGTNAMLGVTSSYTAVGSANNAIDVQTGLSAGAVAISAQQNTLNFLTTVTGSAGASAGITGINARIFSNQSAGTISIIAASQAFADQAGAGTITSAVNYNTAARVSGTGGVGQFTHYAARAPLLTGTGVITAMVAHDIENMGNAKVSAAYGILIRDQTGSATNNALITNAGLVTFNEGGDGNTDVRMESDTEPNMFLLDANGDTDGALYLGGSTNGIKINKGGELTFIGTATFWQDIDFPILIRTTGANIPTLTTINGNITMPLWQVNDFNVCECQELVHQWKENSTVYWHLHLTTGALDATNRYVRFKVEFGYATPNGVWTFPATIDSGDLLIPANTPAKTMIIMSLGSFTPTAAIGGHVVARLTRIAATGAAPGSEPWIPMMQLHIECDSVGSKTISAK